MAIGFNQTKGSAQKEKIETYNYAGKEDHHLRMVGDLLPRYVYWIKGENNKNIPMECLSFDRNSETFNNILAVDLVGAFYYARECGRRMLERRSGSIVNICSIMASGGNENMLRKAITPSRMHSTRTM